MKRARQLARRGQGFVEPNPMVGCVLAQADRIVGEGWHRRFGGAHAEAEALRDAGPDAAGATAYVTLEPCDHVGKTPPCTAALIQAGIRRVVISCLDPNRVAAGGAKRLREAGVDVEIGPGQEQAAELLAPYIKRNTTGLPYVIAKWAQTLDGAIATHTGHSQWISSPASRRLVHRWRGRVDAVMVGIGTVFADDPQLTVRDTRARRIPRRVVVDPHLRFPMDCQLLATLDRAPLTVATTAQAISEVPRAAEQLREAGVELHSTAEGRDADGLLPIEPLLRHLAEVHDATNVLCEGGAGLTAALFRQRLVDEARVFVTGRLMGDGRGLPALRLPGQATPADRVAECISLEIKSLRRSGADVLWICRTQGPSQEP